MEREHASQPADPYDEQRSDANAEAFVGALIFAGGLIWSVIASTNLQRIKRETLDYEYERMQSDRLRGAPPQEGDMPLDRQAAGAAEPGLRFCPACGTAARGGDSFCSKCGERLPAI